MTIVHLSGGFGNQLFSYAFGYAVAKARGDEFAIDTAIQDAPWFFRNADIMDMNITYDKRITYQITRKLWDRALFNKLYFRHAIGFKTKFITEDELKNMDNPIEYLKSIKENIYIKGNWQALGWIKSTLEEVIPKFTFISSLSDGAKSYDECISKDEKSVAIHIRRGDYVRIGVALKPDYYYEAIEYIASKVDNPTFYIFSEDIEWTKEIFKDIKYNLIYVKYESDKLSTEDFRLIAKARHQIISNSTYSWWAAYLNDYTEKIVVCPELSVWTGDFYPEDWVKIKAEAIGKPMEGK